MRLWTRASNPERIVYAHTPRILPDILSADEVVRFLEVQAIEPLRGLPGLETSALVRRPGIAQMVGEMTLS